VFLVHLLKYVLFIGLFVIACVPKDAVPNISKDKTIKISGSDSMFLLTRKWTEEFMKEYPGISIYTYGGGTARGLKDLLDREVQICAASRPLLPAEIRQMAEIFGSVGVTHSVAKEAISIYVHPSNPVKDFTLLQLRKIFTGSIKNWSELGGADQEIEVLTRSPNSGTYLYFMEHVLNQESYSRSARVMNNTKSIIEEVGRNPNAIGYGGFAYGANLRCSVEGIYPTEESIRDKKYPITRYLNLVTHSNPTGETKLFLDWVVSSRGQALVREAGYLALW
jgi:phosphate transport system substrate-binding protein